MTESSPSLCGVCHLKRARYICPRCNAQYCSLDCYQRHSERCTEGFYRDSATQELRSISATDVEKRRMLEILQRLHDQELGDEGGSEDGGSSEEEEEEGGRAALSRETARLLLRKLEAGADITAADLTPQELQEFHRAVAAGEMSEVVEPWRPWWLSEEAAELELSQRGTALVAEQQGAEEEREGGSAEPRAAAASPLPPPPSRPLPPLSALSKAAPSPLLQYHLLDLLYSYCYVLRRFNGDYAADPADAADLLFAVSAVLEATAAGAAQQAGSVAANAPTAASVLLECISRACGPAAGGRLQQGLAVAVLSDVAAVLQHGRATVITALMDLSRLIEAAKQQVGSMEGDKAAKRGQRRLVAAERKLLFFLAWANQQLQQTYGLLAAAVGAELDKHRAATQAAGGAGVVLSAGEASQGHSNIGTGPGVQQGGGRPAATGPLVQEL